MSRPVLVHSNSGRKPGSVTGGTRQTHAARAPEPTPLWLGVTFGEAWVWLAIAALIALCLVLGAL